MPRSPRPTGLKDPRRPALLTSSLIAAAALCALLVVALSAKAQTTTTLVCPRDDRGQPAQLPVRRGARKTLVPPGAIGLIVCSYNGMNASGGVPQWGLRGAGAVDDRRQIGRIIAALDALKPTHGVRWCPMDDDSELTAAFSYGSPPSVTVTIDTVGCNLITNGHVHRAALGRPVVGAVEALAKPITGLTWATVRGHLRVCGGPAPGRCLIENYDSSDRVVVTGSNGLWVAMANVVHGRFALRVAASGTYTFGVYAGNTLVKKLRAEVKVGRTTRVVFLIPVP